MVFASEVVMAKSLVGAVVALPIVLAALAGCSSSSNATVSSGGACGGPASPSASQYLASAAVAFVGIMLPGPDVNVGNGNTLTSPARVRVVRWLKGSGPPVVTVTTGVTRNSAGIAENEDGIMPKAGQHWVIYATSKKMPYQTSICSGSAQSST
jgi:hypothetical protein